MGDTGTETLADKGFSAQPITLTDLDRCRPADALSTEPRRGHWRMIEYETETFSGVILLAGPETGAPEITYSPGVRGWHAISIGTWKLKGWYLTQGSSPELRIKLSGDDTFSVMALPVLPQPSEDPVAG